MQLCKFRLAHQLKGLIMAKDGCVFLSDGTAVPASAITRCPPSCANGYSSFDGTRFSAGYTSKDYAAVALEDATLGTLSAHKHWPLRRKPSLKRL